MRAELLLSGVALAVSFGLAECALRVATPELGRPDDRLLFTTEAPLRDEYGAIRHAPHRSVRSVLMYGDEFEIDTTFTTNDLGLVDHRDYLPAATASPRYAFVGDSYAAGVEGGRPWVPALRDRLGLQAYALGMGATGVLGFERMLQSISRWLSFTDVVFVAISDDFHRDLWRPLTRGDEIRLCAEAQSDAACAEHPPTAYLMRPDTSDADLVERARAIQAARASRRGFMRSWLRESRLLTLLRNAAVTQFPESGQRNLLDESRAALARVRSAYPDARIRFVHVPDRYETERGRYDLDVNQALAGTGIEYLPVLGTCPWSTENYFERDNHPDAAGYEALAQCVAGLLELEATNGPHGPAAGSR